MKKARLNGHVLEIIDYVETPIQVYESRKINDEEAEASIKFEGYEYREKVIDQIDLTEVIKELKE